ncbi:hypothetical protein QH494_02635 [Sphingomonas sp. AR_OL41]|uniref:terminase small subunit-like protein n=1 Tax=Sphingomonas sp. AR_OL41 TaxID=3042729 RepID=UPI00247FB3BA|nr:hypothetical protein [Sphingomonas sp. AR_OL41]MDH7971066.1 hypothetical protein [Sphingomonas sp. AR_OL41]
MSESKPSRKGKSPHANTDIAKIAANIEREDRAITKGDGYKVSAAQYDWALERIASGDTIKNVTTHLKISRASLLKRASVDEDFAKAFNAALAIGVWARLENAEDRLENGTGSVARDKALMDHAHWMATRLASRVFGDKIQVDQRSITINVDKDAADW